MLMTLYRSRIYMMGRSSIDSRDAARHWLYAHFSAALGVLVSAFTIGRLPSHVAECRRLRPRQRMPTADSHRRPHRRAGVGFLVAVPMKPTAHRPVACFRYCLRPRIVFGEDNISLLA